jgi:hypothetical protein
MAGTKNAVASNTTAAKVGILATGIWGDGEEGQQAMTMATTTTGGGHD